MNTKQLLKEARKLDVQQRAELAQEIWATVESDYDDEALSDDLKAELDRRLDALAKNQNAGVEWAEFRKTLRKEVNQIRRKRA